MTENAAPAPSSPPDPVLLVGAVTWDVVDGERIPGGAVTYAARTATALGVRAYVLLAAGDDADLDAFEGHEVARVRVDRTMTLEHRLAGGARQQRVLARPDRTLTPADLPAYWPTPRTMVLGTLLPGDIDVPGLLDLPVEEVAVIGQGLQRAVEADGAVREIRQPTPALLAAARPHVTLTVSEDDVAFWDDRALDAIVTGCRRFVRTRGSRGAEIRTAAGVRPVPALRATPLDPTGAGDVFATALILAMRAGEDVAGRLAAACAAACVERRGSASLPARTEIEARAGILRSSTPGAGVTLAARGERAQGDRS